MIIRARWLLTMDGPPLENGALAVAGDAITDVGQYEEVRGRNSGPVLDLGERMLLPGLINAHCHLDYASLRGSIGRPSSFTAWIRAINERKAALTPDDYLRSIVAGLAEAASFGTTTIANYEAFTVLITRLPASPLRIWWFAEMIDVRERVSPSEIVAAMRAEFAKSNRSLDAIGLAPHAPFTASAALYRDAATAARAESLPFSTHLAESHKEMQMFRDGTGPLFEFMKAIGRPMMDCGTETPLALMLDRGLLDRNSVVVHLNELTESDFELLENAPRFHIVHCPRSHEYFGHTPFPLVRLRELGFNISLGTDSLASNDDLSLFAEMRLLRSAHRSLSPSEILEMVTTRAAAALHQQHQIGGFALA